MSAVSNPPRLVPLAPAFDGRAHRQPEDPTMPYTCITCAKRKVKCDKLSPVCSTCRKTGVTCQYQAPLPRKRKRRAVDEVNDRLGRYEKLLRDNNLLPDAEPTPTTDASGNADESPQSGDRTGSAGDGAQTADKIGQLHASRGKTRYISSNMWRNLDYEDLHPSSEDDDEDTVDDRSSLHNGDALAAALLGSTPRPVRLIEAHPTYDAAMAMWKLHVDNVEPICKLLHIPTTKAILNQVASNPSRASRTNEAIAFAIYHSAISAATDEECLTLFAQSRPLLLAQYLEATRQALANAQFLKTTELAVLQAFVLLLLTTRATCDPHTFWILTGVAVRIGQRLGLHQAALEQGLNPFDVQMRRRTFWQLLPLDGMAAQVAGTGIAIASDSWDTDQPLNINDIDIWPEMTHPPEPREGATEMMFCLARTELARALKAHSPSAKDWMRMWEADDLEVNQKRIRGIETIMESKYLPFCDICEPMHALTMLMCRTAITIGKFRVWLPVVKREDATLEQRDIVWGIADKLLDGDHFAHENPLLKQFDWHVRAYFQWDPLIWMLYELRREPAHFDSLRIWNRFEKTWVRHPEFLLMRRALHYAVCRLTVKAWDACAAHRRAAGRPGGDTEPPIVSEIRVALDRRQNSRARRLASENTPSDRAFDGLDGLPALQPPHDHTLNTVQPFGDLSVLTVDNEDWAFWDTLMFDPNAFASMT